MSTILLVIYYLYTIISLLHSGWAQPNQYSYSLLHSTPKNLCSIPGTHYCTHGSLHSPEILFCVSHTRVELRSCNIELARIIPKGYEGWALCFEFSPDAGDAICAFNGTGYSWVRGSSTIEVPGTGICEDETDETDSIDGVDFISFGERPSSTMGSSASLGYGLEPDSSDAIRPSLGGYWGSFWPVTTPGTGEVSGLVESKRKQRLCFDRGRSRAVGTVFRSGSAGTSSGDGIVTSRSQETTMVTSEGVVVSGLGLGLGSTSACGSTCVSTSSGSLAAWDGTSTVGFPVVTGSVAGAGALGVNRVWYVYALFLFWALRCAW